ncbi:MAG: AI-2E family transporter [Martelella sp.]|uniref:AI-2E family transporter n=1 Tax=Martelella sp. TaxID=1969699 RepID=UPI0032426F17
MNKRESNLTSEAPVRQLGAVAALALLAVIAWQLANLFLVVLGACLIALVLARSAAVLNNRSGISYRLCLTFTVLLFALSLSGFFFFLGSRLASEMTRLAGELPETVDAASKYFNLGEIESWIADHARSIIGDGAVLGNITGFSTALVSAAVGAILMIAGGIYFAVDPAVYRRGLLLLAPARARARVDDLLSALSDALFHWFAGQLVAMVIIGVLTTAGLMSLGISSAFALGLIAGVLEIVPYIGPIASAVPAVAVALTGGVWDAIWVALLYLVIQQAEGVLIAPLIQKRSVHIPPGVMIFAVLGFGALFGVGGMLMGGPLTVVAFVLVRKIWIDRQAGTPDRDE